MKLCPTCGSKQLRVTTLPTGFFKPGLTGTARFQEIRTYFLGPACVPTQIPLYTVTIDAFNSTRTNCQAGRDFTFA